jgi:predicted O-methyltransferase YrrM
MDDGLVTHAPATVPAIRADTAGLGFDMASDARTGALLRVLAASKPGGRLLELGTGTGAATAWLLDGMTADARLVSVDADPAVQAVARRHLGGDPRLVLVTADGGAFVRDTRERFDLVFADAWPGKYEHVGAALALVAPGGVYVVDDMLPQPNWPAGHQARVDDLLAWLDAREDFTTVRLRWSTGLVLATRRA